MMTLCIRAEVIIGIGLFGNVSGELSSSKTRLKRRGCSAAGADTPMVAGREEKVCDLFFTVCHGRGGIGAHDKCARLADHFDGRQRLKRSGRKFRNSVCCNPRFNPLIAVRCGRLSSAACGFVDNDQNLGGQIPDWQPTQTSSAYVYPHIIPRR